MAARLTAYLVALIVGTTFVAGLIVGAQRDDDGPVDLIVVNGRVYTAEGDGTIAEAVAIRGNKILRVGTSREIQRLRRAQTAVLDARGGTVLPGFNDARVHFLEGGLSLLELDLIDRRTVPDIREAVRDWAAKHSERPWVTGRGWSYATFAGGLPTRQILDEIVPDRPAYFTAEDGRTGWANSAALELAGVTRHARGPADGLIVKDPRTGEPTGVLKEAAMQLLTPFLQEPTRTERLAALGAAMEHAHRRGVTSVQDASGNVQDLELFDELRRAGRLNVRVYSALSVGHDLTSEEREQLDRVRARYPDDPLFKAGAIRIVADRFIDSEEGTTAELSGNRQTIEAEPHIAEETLNRLVATLDSQGWQIMLHSSTDRALGIALDALERVSGPSLTSARGRRHRVEHSETVGPSDVPRFASLGVIASMQPYRGFPNANPMSMWSSTPNADRTSLRQAYGSIVRSGGRLAFGSDWPVAPLNPLLGLHAAADPTTPEGDASPEWNPSDRLTLQQALDAYTRTAAWASFDEHRKGTVASEMLADLVVLSADIFALPLARLTEVEVTATVFDGKVVYRRSRATS